MMKATQLASNLYVLDGAVNTGVLVCGGKGLLIDCCDTVTPQRLREIGVDTVEMILCTQHRGPNAAGAYPFVKSGAKLVVPAAERHLFDDVERYWSDPANRWHIYHHQPGPQVLPRSMPVARAVQEGDVVRWEDYAVRVLDTPGATDGSVSYLVEADGRTIAFSGDAIYGPGQLWDLSSLQKGNEQIRDYHGFIGNRVKLLPSLEKLGSCGADLLVPSHGDLIEDPETATAMAVERLDAIWRNYTAVSSLNHYFPKLFEDTADDPQRMPPVQTHDPPPFVRRVSATSFAVISDTDATLVMDCGAKSVIDTLQKWRRKGVVKSVDGCWVTHYHDDHVDALKALHDAFGCPVLTDEHMAEIVEHPERFFLPCISPHPAPVTRATKNGESWQWHEFTLTAFHFPGQTYYHSGLLVAGHGKKVFFAGDSGSPTGIDDHCCPNRNLLGEGTGFRRCIEIWRQHKPDYIFNEHQDRAFSFTDKELDYVDANLAERERLFGQVLPWPDPNFGTDENWVRTYPYEQEVQRGTAFSLDVQFTNRGPDEATATVEPALPDRWTWDREASIRSTSVPAKTDGSVDTYCRSPDRAARLRITTPADAPAGRYVIPVRVTWAGRYLGQFRHAIVTIA